MRKAGCGTLWSLAALAALLLLPAADAGADGMRSTRHAVYYNHYPLGRHVLEGIHPPGSPNFLINGRYFTAASPSCARWLPADPIRLVAGDWNGYCETAVFRNLRRGGTCTMWCR